MPPFLASIGVRLAAVAALALVLVALWWRMDAATERADAAEREMARLNGEMDRADQAVQQAERVNGAMRDAILRLNAENEANRARATRLEADATVARRAAAQAAELARSEDSQRRARLNKPSAAEMTAVLRGIVGAM